MTDIQLPESVRKDLNRTAARLDRDHAICLKNLRISYNSNAVDFSYLCENLKVLDCHGRPTDDSGTWTRFVGYLGDLMVQYGELQARQAEVRAEAGKRIVVRVRLFSHEIEEVARQFVQDIPAWIHEFVNSPEYRAAFAFADASATATEKFIKAFASEILTVGERAIQSSRDGLDAAPKILNEIEGELEALRREAASLRSSAAQAGEMISTRIRALKLPDDLKGSKGTAVAKAEFYAQEVSKIAADEIDKLSVGAKVTGYIEKMARAFRWLSIASAINEILLADDKVRQTLMEIAAFGMGALISGAFAALLLPLGPVLFIPLFIIFAGIASYYGTELAKDTVGAVYDWVVEGTPPAFN